MPCPELKDCPEIPSLTLTIPVEALRMVLTGVNPVVYTSWYHTIKGRAKIRLSEHMHLGSALFAKFLYTNPMIHSLLELWWMCLRAHSSTGAPGNWESERTVVRDYSVVALIGIRACPLRFHCACACMCPWRLPFWAIYWSIRRVVPRKQSLDHRSTLSGVGRHSNLLSRASMSTAVARSFPRSKATEENRVGGRKASKPVLSHTTKKQVSGSGEELFLVFITSWCSPASLSWFDCGPGRENSMVTFKLQI